MRKRKVRVEPVFAEAKDWHGLRRFRLRRLTNVNIVGPDLTAVRRWLGTHGIDLDTETLREIRPRAMTVEGRPRTQRAERPAPTRPGGSVPALSTLLLTRIP